MPGAFQEGRRCLYVADVPGVSISAWERPSTGTHDSLLEASEFVRTLQNRQGIQIACLEEIAFERGWISVEDAWAAGERYKKTAYGRAILNAVEDAR